MYRVLLVEDEEIIRKGIRYSVPWEECGCSVVGEAENGAVGEEKIAELQPDIVITDITMPVKNGLEMIADTREKFNYIAIILTGYSEFEYAQQAIRNGVSDYVLKPLDMDEMRTALEKAVRLAGDNQYLQQREDEAEAVRRRTALRQGAHRPGQRRGRGSGTVPPRRSPGGLLRERQHPALSHPHRQPDRTGSFLHRPRAADGAASVGV